MWNRILGKSTDPDNKSSTVEGRQRGESQSSTPRRADSTKSTSSSRRSRRNEESDKGFNPTSTSYSSTSRNNYPGTAAASIGSSYATASSNPTSEPYFPPGLVRNASLANQIPTSLAEHDDRTPELDSSSKPKREKGDPESMEHKRDRKERRGTRDGDEDRKESKSGRDRKTKRDSGKRERGMSTDEVTYTRSQRSAETTRVSDRPSESSISVALSGQYSTTGPESAPGQSQPQSSHVQDQFPGQFPAQASAPYRPPLAASEGGPGLAAAYYGDAGQSVADQPGFRVHSPSLIIGAEPHLQAASAVAAPPPEPSASGGVGAAASFFDGSFNGASDTEDHHGQGQKPTPTTTSSVSQHSSAVPPASTYATSSAAPTYHSSSSAPAIPTLGAAAAGAAAGYYMANHSSNPARPDKTSASMSGYGNLSVSSGYHQQHSETHDSYTANLASDRPSTRPGKYSSQSSNIPLYAAGAAGVAAAAYHHSNHNSSQHTSHAEHYNGGSMSQQHRHRDHGPFSKLVDFFKDPDGVAQFEEYTEYIGVCKYCFPPGSSPRDAPRKHHYRRRRSTEKLRSSVRVDKDKRYWSSENENRRRKDKSWLEAGIAGYGLGKMGESLFGYEKESDDRHSIKSGRARRSRRSSTSSSERKSHISRGVITRSSDTSSRRSPSHGRVETGITSDGKLYRKDSHGHIETTAIKSQRSRRRSRSSSRDRKETTSNTVLGATIGSTVSGSTSRHRSKSPKKAFVRSKRRHEEDNSELASILRLRESEPRDSHRRSRHSPDRTHREGHRKEKKSRGFFNFTNGSSSSSSSSNLSFGASHDRKARNGAKSAAAAALALNQKNQRSKRRGELVAVKEKHRTSKHDHKGKKSNPSSDEDLWESASNGEWSSADSELAYGAPLHRRSQESLSSESSGLDKWSWRWGSKKQTKETAENRRRSSGIDHVLPVSATSAVMTGTAQIPSTQWQDSRMNSTGSVPMQHVYPMPTSDPTQFDVTGHQDPRVPFQQPFANPRPGPVPIQHPQPVAPVSSSVYTSQAPLPHSYTAPAGPSTFAQPPLPSSAISRQSRNEVPGAFPTGGEYFETFIRDSSKDSSLHRRDTSPVTRISDPASSSSAGQRRRKSLKEDSSVRFDLTKEQEEKDLREERRRGKQDERRRERQEWEEQQRAEEDSRSKRDSSRRESNSRSKRDSREEAPKDENASWAAPAAAGAVAAIVGATVAAEKSRKEQTKYPGRDERDIEVSMKERSAAPKDTRTEEIDGRGRPAEKESVWRAAAKIRRSSSHTDYAAYFSPSDVLSKSAGAKESAGPNADADIAIHRAAHVITVEPSEFQGNTPSRAYSFPIADEDVEPKKKPLPWSVPMLNLVEPTPPTSRAGSVVGSRSPQSRSPLSQEVPVEIPLEPLESIVDTDVRYTEPEQVEYAVIEPKERTMDPVVDSPVNDTNASEAVPGISSLMNRNSRKKPQPKADYGDDLDFAATVAAGLQDTGFNPSIVIDDPSFRRRDSPPGSEDDELRSGRTGFVIETAPEIPRPRSPPHGFVEEIPEHHMPGSFEDEEEDTVTSKPRAEKSNGYTRPSDNAGIKPHVYTVEPDASETADVKNATIEPVEYQTRRKRDMSDRRIEHGERTGPSDNAATKPRVYSAEPLVFEPEAVGNASIDISQDKEDDERRTRRRQPLIKDATEPGDNAQAKPQIYTAEPEPIDLTRTRDVAADPGHEGQHATSSPSRVSRSRSLNDSSDIVESLSDEAPSMAAPASVVSSSKRDSKSSKKSKRRSVGFDDTASTASPPATYSAPSDSKGQAKKGRKGGVFGLFSKSVEKLPEANGSQETPVEASHEDFEEPKKRSKKSKSRKAPLDDDEISTPSTPSERVSSSQAEAQDDWSTSKKSKRGKEKRRSSEGTSAQDSGRITQNLPAQVMAPASHDHDPLTASNEKLTNPEDQGLGRSPYQPGPSRNLDDVEDRRRAHDGQQPSFLEERLEQPRSPDLPDTSEDPGGQADIERPKITDEDPQSSEVRVDSPTARAEKQKWRLSDLQSNGRSASYSSYSTPSPTAIPVELRFRRRPSSPGPTGSLPSTPDPSTAVEPPFTPRRRERPHSTEFKISNEFRPMWLLEKHGSRQDPALQEVLPSLPSSHSTSRTSSMHESDDRSYTQNFHDAFENLDPSQTTPEPSGLAIDTSHREIESELLDSQQATPTAASFHSALKDGNDDTYPRQPSPTAELSKPEAISLNTQPEAQQDPHGEPSEHQRLLHGINDLFPRPRSTSPSRYDAVLDREFSPRSQTRASSSLAPGKKPDSGFNSLLEDASLGAFIGGSAAALLKSASQHDEQLERSSKNAAKEEMPMPETAKSSPIRPTAEELRLRQEQDAQDAVDSWFAAPSPKNSRESQALDVQPGAAAPKAPLEHDEQPRSVLEGMPATAEPTDVASTSRIEDPASSIVSELPSGGDQAESTGMDLQAALLNRKDSKGSKKKKTKKRAPLSWEEDSMGIPEAVPSKSAQVDDPAVPPTKIELSREPEISTNAEFEDTVNSRRKSKKGKKRSQSLSLAEPAEEGSEPGPSDPMMDKDLDITVADATHPTASTKVDGRKESTRAEAVPYDFSVQDERSREAFSEPTDKTPRLDFNVPMVQPSIRDLTKSEEDEPSTSSPTAVPYEFTPKADADFEADVRSPKASKEGSVLDTRNADSPNPAIANPALDQPSRDPAFKLHGNEDHAIQGSLSKAPVSEPATMIKSKAGTERTNVPDQPEPESIPLPLDDDLDLLEALLESPVLRPVDALQPAGIDHSFLSQGQVPASHHEPSKINERSVSEPLHANTSLEQSMTSPDAAPATLPKVISELDLPGIAVDPSSRVDEPLVQDPPEEERPAFTSNKGKGKKGRRGRTDMSSQAQAEIFAAKSEQVNEDSAKLLYSMSDDASAIEIDKAIEQAARGDGEWTSSQRRNGKKSKKVTFDKSSEPQSKLQIDTHEGTFTPKPSSATVDTAKEVEHLLHESDSKDAVHDPSGQIHNMPPDRSNQETVDPLEEPLSLNPGADIPAEPLAAQSIELLEEDGTDDQAYTASKHVVATTGTAAEVQEMLRQAEEPQSQAEAGEGSLLSEGVKEADEFAWAPPKKKKGKKSKPKDTDTAKHEASEPAESIKGEASAPKEVPESDPWEGFAVKKSKKDKKGKHKDLQRSDTEVQELPHSTPVVEGTPEVREMSITDKAPSIFQKTDKLPNIEIPSSPQVPSSATLHSKIALPQPGAAQRESSITSTAEDAPPGPAVQEYPIIVTEDTSHAPGSREMGISAKAPSILEKNDQVSSTRETSLTEAVQTKSMSPVISPDDAAFIDAAREELQASTIRKDQSISLVEPNTTLLPIEEPSSFAKLEDVGIPDAALPVQEAYNQLPDDEPTKVPIPFSTPPISRDDAADRSVDDTIGQALDTKEDSDEPVFQPPVSKKDKKKAKKAEALERDEGPVVSTPKESPAWITEAVVLNEEPAVIPAPETIAKSKKDKKKSKKSKALDWTGEPTTSVTPESSTPFRGEEIQDEEVPPQALPLDAARPVTAAVDEDLPIRKKDKKKAKKAKSLQRDDDILQNAQPAAEQSAEPVPDNDDDDDVPFRDEGLISKKEKKKAKKVKASASKDVPEEPTEDRSSLHRVADPLIDQPSEPIIEEPPPVVESSESVDQGSRQAADSQIEEDDQVSYEQPISKKGKKKGKKPSFVALDEEPSTPSERDSVPVRSEAIAAVGDEPEAQQIVEPSDDQPASKKGKKKGKKSKFAAWDEGPSMPSSRDEMGQSTEADVSMNVAEIHGPEAIEEDSKASVPKEFDHTAQSADRESRTDTAVLPRGDLDLPSMPAAVNDVSMPKDVVEQFPDPTAQDEPNRAIVMPEHQAEATFGPEATQLAEVTKSVDDHAENVMETDDTSRESDDNGTVLPPVLIPEEEPCLDKATFQSYSDHSAEQASDLPLQTDERSESAPSAKDALEVAEETIPLPPEIALPKTPPLPIGVEEEQAISNAALKTTDTSMTAEEPSSEPLEEPIKPQGDLPLDVSYEPTERGTGSTTGAADFAEKLPLSSTKDEKKSKEAGKPLEEGGEVTFAVPEADPIPAERSKEAGLSIDQPVGPSSTSAEQIIEIPSTSKKDRKKAKRNKALLLGEEVSGTTTPSEVEPESFAPDSTVIAEPTTEVLDEYSFLSKKDKKKAKKNKALLLGNEMSGASTPVEPEADPAIDLGSERAIAEQAAQEPAATTQAGVAEAIDDSALLSKKDKKKDKKKRKAMSLDNEPFESMNPESAEPKLDIVKEAVEKPTSAAGSTAVEPSNEFPSISVKDKKKGKKSKKASSFNDEASESITPAASAPELDVVEQLAQEPVPVVESSTAEPVDEFPLLGKKAKKKAKKGKQVFDLDDEPSESTTPALLTPKESGGDIPLPREPDVAEGADDFPAMSKKDKKKAKKIKKALTLDEGKPDITPEIEEPGLLNDQAPTSMVPPEPEESVGKTMESLQSQGGTLDPSAATFSSMESEEQLTDHTTMNVPLPTATEPPQTSVDEADVVAEPHFEPFVSGKKSKKDKKKAQKAQTIDRDDSELAGMPPMTENAAFTEGRYAALPEAEKRGRVNEPIFEESVEVVKSPLQEEVAQDAGGNRNLGTFSPTDLPIDMVREVPEEDTRAALTDEFKGNDLSRAQSVAEIAAERKETAPSEPMLERSEQIQSDKPPAIISIIETDLAPRHQDPAIITPTEIVEPEVPGVKEAEGDKPDVRMESPSPTLAQMEMEVNTAPIAPTSQDQVSTSAKEVEAGEPSIANIPAAVDEEDDGFESFAPVKKSKKGKKARNQPIAWEDDTSTRPVPSEASSKAVESNMAPARPEMAAWPTEVRLNQGEGMLPTQERSRSPVNTPLDPPAKDSQSPPDEPFEPPAIEDDRSDYFSHPASQDVPTQPPLPLDERDDLAASKSDPKTPAEDLPPTIHEERSLTGAIQPDVATEQIQQPAAVTEQSRSQEIPAEAVDESQGFTANKKGKKSKGKKKKSTVDDIMWEFPPVPPPPPMETDTATSAAPGVAMEVAVDPLSAELLKKERSQKPTPVPDTDEGQAGIVEGGAVAEGLSAEQAVAYDWDAAPKRSKKGKKSKKGKAAEEDEYPLQSTSSQKDPGIPPQFTQQEIRDKEVIHETAPETYGPERSKDQHRNEDEHTVPQSGGIDVAIATVAAVGIGAAAAQQLGRKESKKGKKTKKSRQASNTGTEQEEREAQPPTDTSNPEPEQQPLSRVVTPERRSPIQAWHQYISPSQSPKQSELYEVKDEKARSVTPPSKKRAHNQQRSPDSTPERRRSPIEAWHEYNTPRHSSRQSDFDEHDSKKMKDRDTTNRDSAVHVSDSPVMPQRSPVHRLVRDSGYPETEASPVVGVEKQNRDDTPGMAQDAGSTRSIHRHENREGNALGIASEDVQGYDVRGVSRQKKRERSRSRSSIRREPSYDDASLLPKRRSHPNRSFEELGEPSPVSSTTRDRSSVLFHSSPSTREGNGSHDQDAAIRSLDPPREDNSAVVNARAESLAALSGLRGPISDQQRSSLFGGPIGHSSDSPIDHEGAPRRSLNTITEYSPEESPLHKKDRDVSDVGAPEHGVKAPRRSGTPLAIAKRRSRARSPPAEDRMESLSPDDHISRRSAPSAEVGKDSTVEQQRTSSRQSNMSSLVSGQPKQREYERRSMSGASNRSIESIDAIIRTPPPDQMRSASGLSNRSSGTPPLRRSDRSISGDLRGANRKNADAKKGAKTVEAETETPIIPSSTSHDNDTGLRKSRVKEMANVFEGYGDSRGSPLSPTRPPSVRRRQSMQVLELESKLEQLVAENRSLFDAKSRAEHGLEEAAYGREQEISSYREGIESRDVWIQQKDTELTQLKETLESLQGQVEELQEVNEGLHAASRDVAHHHERYGRLEEEHADIHQRWQSSTRELEDLRQQHTQLSAGMEDIVSREVSTAVEAKNAELQRLQSELEAAKDQIRNLQQQILASKRHSPDSSFLAPERDEDYFDVQCQSLCQHVQQWVLRFSKFSDSRACYLSSEIRDQTIVDRMDNAILDGSEVDLYLADRVKRRDVFMSIVMTMTWEFIFTRYLFGADREQRQKLKSLEKTLSDSPATPRAAVHRWRATTLQLLSCREKFREQRAQDTEAVMHTIFSAGFRIAAKAAGVAAPAP
ncbi:MAG: hypothetical protein Q9203_003070, partial [Teloschistes exilis]